MNKQVLGDVFKTSKELEDQITLLWFTFALQLESCIPTKLRIFSDKQKWNSKNKDFNLPKLLRKITQTRDPVDILIPCLELKEYGFTGCDDFEEKIQLLQNAWRNNIQVEVCKDELPRSIKIRLSAIGLEE